MTKVMPSTARTAIARTKPSTPMRWLNEQGNLMGRTLDYGCGRGVDAKHFGLESYDPHFQPKMPTGKFDTITCVYVLNVLEPRERAAVVERVMPLLKRGGKAYFVVRRDKLTTKGQYNVMFPFEPMYERKGAFAVYEVMREI